MSRRISAISVSLAGRLLAASIPITYDINGLRGM